jgi:hypothetical protein
MAAQVTLETLAEHRAADPTAMARGLESFIELHRPDRTVS